MTCLRHGRKAGGYWAAQNGRSRRSQSCGDRSISALGVARSPSEEISALSTGLPKHQAHEQPAGRNTALSRASAFPPRRRLTSRPSSLQIGCGVMRRLNIEDRLALSLRPRALTHVRQRRCSFKAVAPSTRCHPNESIPFLAAVKEEASFPLIKASERSFCSWAWIRAFRRAPFQPGDISIYDYPAESHTADRPQEVSPASRAPGVGGGEVRGAEAVAGSDGKTQESPWAPEGSGLSPRAEVCIFERRSLAGKSLPQTRRKQATAARPRNLPALELRAGLCRRTE
ncbi:hypothetical protein NDU88_010148 [Pleurodeles waltl]|uniref:Uncharacterized protein n=1 Tax=Pleurodeles waltl TaxID=8319 RepID=A0AAV7PX41_PLEWA|nr:hypothetical protein NDU88_010148 [Pleurodeles waltl]